MLKYNTTERDLKMKRTDNQSIYVVAICGSLRRGSTTHAALQVALSAAEAAGAKVELLDLSEYELIFQGAVASESDYPSGVFKLREKVQRADGILLGSPEYHGSFSGVLKSALDLMGVDEFENKVIGLIGGVRRTHGSRKCYLYVTNGRRCAARLGGPE